MNKKHLTTSPAGQFFWFSVIVFFTAAQPCLAQDQQFSLGAPCTATEDTLKLSFLDVGQGDAALITCPGGSQRILIDAGDTPEQYPKADTLFLEAFDERMAGNKRIDLAILTHPHPDHSYGFIPLLSRVAANELEIAHFMGNGAENAESEIDDTIRHKLNSLSIPYENVLETGRKKIALCRSDDTEIDLHFVYPTGAAARKLQCPQNFNDCSLVSHFTYAGHRVHLMADATRNWERLAETLSRYPMPYPTDILKIGHHGAASPSPEFMERMKPQFSVISSGKHTLGSTAERGYPLEKSVEIIKQYFTSLPGTATLPRYQLPTCKQNSKNGRCSWTNTVVPSTLLATAKLGSIDMYLQPGQICIQTELFQAGLYSTNLQ